MPSLPARENAISDMPNASMRPRITSMVWSVISGVTLTVSELCVFNMMEVPPERSRPSLGVEVKQTHTDRPRTATVTRRRKVRMFTPLLCRREPSDTRSAPVCDAVATWWESCLIELTDLDGLAGVTSGPLPGARQPERAIHHER